MALVEALLFCELGCGPRSSSPPRSYSQSTLLELDRADRLAAENKAFLAALDDAVKRNEPLELDTLPRLSVTVIA